MTKEKAIEMLEHCLFKLDSALFYYKAQFNTGGNITKIQLDLLNLLKKQIKDFLVNNQDEYDFVKSYKLYQSVRYCNLIMW